MPVSTVRKEYASALKNWSLVDDIVNNDAMRHLRDVDKSNKERNLQYKKYGVLTNFTRLTLEGLTGLVFRKPLQTTLPPELEYLKADATGTSLTLEQLATKEVWELLKKGRYGLLADTAPEQGSLPRIKAYDCFSIINWGYIRSGDKYKLNLVVLKECVDYLDEDGFTWIEDYQFRVLRLENDIYYQELWNSKEELIDIFNVTDHNNKYFNEIPFVFLGSENNDADVDNPPMLDLAIVNLSHYRCSCDAQETSFIAGQVQPVTQLGENMNKTDWDEANPSGLSIGSLSNIIVGAGGDFNFRQAQGNLLPQQLMRDAEIQAAAIGARLIAPPGSGRESAEGAKIRYGSQNSRLYVITKNINIAMEMILYWCAKFAMENPVASTFILNDVFYEDTVDPNELMAELQMFDRGIMSAKEIRDNAKRAGMKLDDSFKPDPVQINPLTSALPAVMGNE